jgi:hypothetical protein
LRGTELALPRERVAGPISCLGALAAVAPAVAAKEAWRWRPVVRRGWLLKEAGTAGKRQVYSF